MKTYLCHFQSSDLGTIHRQADIINWLKEFHLPETRALVEKYAIHESMIASRKSFAAGICTHDKDMENNLYNLGEQQPNLSKRASFSQQILSQAVNELYQDEDQPDAINHISCTHYQSPSVVQNLICEKEWHKNTLATHLYHMGCYASLPGIRVANSYVNTNMDRVDNIHTELCSFHLNQKENIAEKIIMQTLFSDGVIKYSCVNEETFLSGSSSGFQILAQLEELVPNTEKEMTWALSDDSFVMSLSKKVPMLLAKKIEKFMEDLFSKAGYSYREQKEKALFAIHPGGPKIIELAQRVLDLNQNQIQASLDILKTRGNMSSATLPFIWSKILSDNPKPDQLVATVAFGPGLTITGALFKICKP